jgi:hypothetical protein
MKSKVYNEDVFETMKRIETGSINLIICDGPYFKICGGFDWAFKTMQEWIDWHILLRDEFERIMADNGSLFVFGDEKNIAYLQVEFDKKFNLLNSIVYKKNTTPAIKGLEGCNSFVPMTERILFYDKGKNKTGLNFILKQPGFYGLMKYFKNERLKLGWTYSQCDNYLGIKASYCYWDKPTTHIFCMPEEKHYKKLQQTGYAKNTRIYAKNTRIYAAPLTINLD